jgi:hypothetical protein
MEKASLIIPDLESELVNYVRSKLSEKLASKRVIILGKYRGASIYNFGDDQNGYVTLVHNGNVVYFVRYKRIRHNGFKLGRQVLLWRDRDHQDLVTNGFAQYVFFNLLLPRFGALIADKEQTRNGSAFWTNACIVALDKGLKVYCLDRRSRKTQLSQIQNHEDLEIFAPILWGKTPQHLLTFAVISQNLLSLTPKETK